MARSLYWITKGNCEFSGQEGFDGASPDWAYSERDDRKNHFHARQRSDLHPSKLIFFDLFRGKSQFPDWQDLKGPPTPRQRFPNLN